MLKASNLSFNAVSIQSRMPKAKVWLTEYNKEAMITLRKTPNTEAWDTIIEGEKQEQHIQELHDHLQRTRQHRI